MKSLPKENRVHAVHKSPTHMTLLETLERDMKEALKAGEKVRLQVLRMVRSVIQNAEIAKQAVLNEADVLKVIQSELKKRKESIEAYVSAKRTELAEQEKKEAEVLEGYLPKQLTDAELDDMIKNTAEKTGATEKKDMGRLMGTVMKDVGARAPGNRVKERVSIYLT